MGVLRRLVRIMWRDSRRLLLRLVELFLRFERYTDLVAELLVGQFDQGIQCLRLDRVDTGSSSA